MIDNLEVRIERRENSHGHPYTEIFYTWDENGVVRYASTRDWAPIPNTEHQRAYEAQAFRNRRAANY